MWSHSNTEGPVRPGSSDGSCSTVDLTRCTRLKAFLKTVTLARCGHARRCAPFCRRADQRTNNTGSHKTKKKKTVKNRRNKKTTQKKTGRTHDKEKGGGQALPYTLARNKPDQNMR